MTTKTVTKFGSGKIKHHLTSFFNMTRGHFDLILSQTNQKKVARCVRGIYPIPMKQSEERQLLPQASLPLCPHSLTQNAFHVTCLFFLSVLCTDVNSSIHPNQEMYKNIYICRWPLFKHFFLNTERK